MLAREALVRLLLTQEGVHEVGHGNRGPKVEEYQKADDLPGEGYAWCVSFVQWGAKLLGIELPSKTASVGLLEQACRREGWMRERPYRGYLAFWRIGADSWPDHIFVITRVVRLGPVWGLRTIEGNTSASDAGSQDNGGQVAQRLRFIPRSKVTFAEVPGTVAASKLDLALAVAGLRKAVAKEKPSAAKKVVRAIVPARRPITDADWTFGRWYLGLAEFAHCGPRNKVSRPAGYPAKVPANGWRAVKWYDARRKASA